MRRRPRLPLLVISPFAKVNFVDGTFTDQTSIVQFIEDNWLGGSADRQRRRGRGRPARWTTCSTSTAQRSAAVPQPVYRRAEHSW